MGGVWDVRGDGSAARQRSITSRKIGSTAASSLPLSRSPEDLPGDLDWTGMVLGLAVGSTVAAVLANRFVTWQAGIAIAGALVAVEAAWERASRRSRLLTGG